MTRSVSFDRRALMAVFGGLVVLPAGQALAAPGAEKPGSEKVVRLWPGTPPGSEGVTAKETVTDKAENPGQPNRSIAGVRDPELTIRYPAKPNGAAVLVLPGGGFRNLAYDKEGTEVADWLLTLGFVTGVLKYRLPADGWKAGVDVAVQDGQRAMRLLRQEVKGGKVGVMGFSAGGYLGAALALRFEERLDGKVDAADAQSARPDFAALVYAAFGAPGSLVPPLEPKLRADAPPIFLIHAADDSKAMALGSLIAATKLAQLKVPVELHLFEKGEHGFAVRRPPAKEWSPLFDVWVRRHLGT